MNSYKDSNQQSTIIENNNKLIINKINENHKINSFKQY